MKKVKEFKEKLVSLSTITKVRILSSFLCVLLLIVGSITYFGTLSEMSIAFSNDPSYVSSRVEGSTVYVNDLVADLNNYYGQNYIYSSNGSLPTTTNKNIYTENNLVQAKITYRGYDLTNTDHGYVSPSESQDTYIYFKAYPVDTNNTSSTHDDFVLIELIDNPFTKRPNGKGFNGWVTRNENALITLDMNYYKRYVKIPVTYSNNIPEKIEIEFFATWIDADDASITSTGNGGWYSTNPWTAAINALANPGLHQITVKEKRYRADNMEGFFHQLTINRYTSYVGYYDEYGVAYTNGTCNSNRGCTVYQKIENETFNNNNTYYELVNGRLTRYDNENKAYWAVISAYENKNMASYFREVHINNGSPYTGYYNSAGEIQTGTCNTNSGCTYYELIQYSSNGNPNIANTTDIYYYLTTRDTNIVYLRVNGLSRTWSSTNKPFTFTAVYNGSLGNYQWTANNLTVICYSDVVIENMLIYGPTRTNDYAPPYSTNSNGSLIANFHNVKLGRGLTRSGTRLNFAAIIGGTSSTGSNGSPTKYSLLIESGFYNGIGVVYGANSRTQYNAYVLAKPVYGNDYDKAHNKDNTKLDVYYTSAGSWSGHIYASTDTVTSTEVSVDLVVKSGAFGSNHYDYAAGIYVGGLNYGEHRSSRRARIEGGDIYNLIGGPLVPSSRANVNDIIMNISGGEIDMVIGGAGRSATYGNRIINITGGKVNYSVFGGSNSYSGSDGEGTLNGSTYVYVGGNAVIGDSTLVSNQTKLFGAEAGSVFGIGNGKSGTSTIGSADNSTIVIDGNANILGNVYGGGNYGATGVSSSNTTTSSTIVMYDGMINGDIYGGGNNNGAGDSSTVATIDITMYKGNVLGSIYGGSNAQGTIYGSTNVKVYGGEVTNSVYGGGRGGYSSSSSTGTFVARNSSVTIGDNNIGTTPIINGSVFGGSAYGTVNGTTRTTTLSSYNTSVTVNKGRITSVFGGGQGSSTYEPYVEGNVTVTINDGTITNVYGANDAAGVPNGTIKVYLKGGSVQNTFGGGNNAGANTTNVYLQGGSSGRIFGGSNAAGNVTTANVTCTSGTCPTVYGGNNLGGSTGTTNVTINGGDIITVYGGGEQTDVTTASNVTLRSEVTTLFGGSNTAGTVKESHVTLENGVAKNVYGGNNAGGTTTDTNITVNGCVTNNIYGGGKKAPSTTSTIDFNHGYSGNVFGGGSEAGVTTTNVNLNKGLILNTFGGSDISGNVTTSNVNTINGNITKDNIAVSVEKSVSNVNQTNTTGHSSSENLAVTISNNTGATLTKWTLYLVTGAAVLDSNWSSATITYDAGVFKVTEINQYYGTNPIASNGSYNFNFNIHSYVPYDDFEVKGYYIIGYDSSNNKYVAYSYNDLEVDKLYGGNNAGGVTTSANIDLEHGTINQLYGGGAYAVTGTSNVELENVTITDSVFGGGDNASITSVTANITSSTIGSQAHPGAIYGGGDAAAVDQTVNLTIDGNTQVNGSVFGGGNNGDVSGKITLNIDESTITNVYGGGNNADARGNIEINAEELTANYFYGGGNNGETFGTITTEITDSTVSNNIFGGGNNGDVNNKVDLEVSGTTAANIFGGGNNAEVDGNVELKVNSSSIITDSIYGGGNYGITTGNVDITLNTITVTNNIFGGGNNGDVSGNVTLSANTATVSGNVYGGGNNAKVEGNITSTVASSTIANTFYGGGNNGRTDGIATSTITSSTVTNAIYGGGNQAEVGTNAAGTSSVLTLNNATTCNVFGGGNAAAIIGSTNVTVSNSTITCNVFGGGNGINSIVSGDLTGEMNPAKVTGNTTVLVNNNTTVGESVYGGGNLGHVAGNTSVTTNGISVTENIFGGGNAARVKGNTHVLVTNASVSESVYAGGNGVTAIVEGSTNLDIEGTTNITRHVFGGGNAAATGLESNNNSTGIVNIVGATIGGNVYGGANTSVLYGITTLNIGKNAVNKNSLTPGNISIGGTVFGGGEANASGSENYDYSFISVTTGININIDASDHNVFNINGSIFGSGNASSTTGYSYIVIKNYGAVGAVKNNISIQRADVVTLDNSHIKLAGATDRTNEYSDVLFTLSRIDELKIKNNTSLYLKTGANLLKKFTSLVDVNNEEVKATVDIDDENKTVTRNVNNRLYMLEDKNLNVATNENITSYGDVSGMTFFGMYREGGSGQPVTALYNTSYNYGDNATAGDAYYFTSGSYVLGRHYDSHDIEVDGFYSNDLVSEESTELKTFYIEPTPADASFYMWVVGKQVVTYEVNLTASKYSTLGVEELSFINYARPNTKLSILGFNYDGLAEGVNLINPSNISRVAQSNDYADHNMGLTIKPGQTGWVTVGETTFLSNQSQPVVGTTTYEKENSTAVPSLLFYLYHSKNLGESGDMGTATISLVMITPIDDLSNEVERININVNISRAIYTTNDYEATITTGKKYEMFASSNVKITDKSSFSAFFSLFMETDQTPYRTGDYRALVSSYILPENTKITMIDYHIENRPVYYYYVVSAADVVRATNEYALNDEATYKLSNFVKMGSTSANNKYDDSVSNGVYYNSSLHYVEEEFIFIVDFKDTTINADVLNNSFLIERRSVDDQTVLAVLGIEQGNMVYDLYHNKDAIIDLSGTIDTLKFYNGNNMDININTNFIQQKVLSDTIIDTNYYDQQLGIKISIYDSYNNKVTSSSLLGIYFENNGIIYYPRDNGETRIKIAERVANISSRIKVHAENSSLAGGDYKIVIESFGSPDGVYYGLESSDTLELNLKVMDTLYGLTLSIPENCLFWDKDTGKNLNKSNALLATVSYESGLNNPNLRIKLYRRDYSEIYSTTYNEVDFADYFSTVLTSSGTNEYILTDNPVSNLTYFLYMKDSLTSGTYKLEIRLYDENTYIGEIYRYIIIK